MSLATVLRSKREAVGLTQVEVAVAAGMARSYLSRLEHGAIKRPSAVVLIRLAKALHIPPDELFRAAGYITPPIAAEQSNPTVEYLIQSGYNPSDLSPEVIEAIDRFVKFAMQEEQRKKGEAQRRDRPASDLHKHN